MTIIEAYRHLLTEIDSWFSLCQQNHPEEIACSMGCSECCRGLFDITILDAALLNIGFEGLPDTVRLNIREKAEGSLREIMTKWPEFNHPFILNLRPEEEREALMGSDNETPCVLLDNAGRCLLYEYRPMTCRLHGLPLVDVSGEVMEGEWCTKNFTRRNPIQEENLWGDFDRMLHKEVVLGRAFTVELLGQSLTELDTFIPTALLLDFRDFDWRKWYAESRLRT